MSHRRVWKNAFFSYYSSDDRRKSGLAGTKQVIVVVGSEWLFANHNNTFGELNQWSDLWAALHLLGCDVKFLYTTRHVTEKALRQADVIFTDYFGIWNLKEDEIDYRQFSEKIWVLDIFGTQKPYTKAGSRWAELPPSRFLTSIPGYAPENTFLGNVVVPNPPKAQSDEEPRQWRAVLWTKGSPGYDQLPCSTISAFLNEIKDFIPIVATVPNECALPAYVERLGVLSVEEFQKLLRTSAIYIGLGHKMIGPSAIEALGSGLILVQPKFDPGFVYQDKPTKQPWSSQHPFLERRFSAPLVYSIDYGHPYTVAASFQEIASLYCEIFGNARKHHFNSNSRKASEDVKASLQRHFEEGTFAMEFSAESFLKRVSKLVFEN